MILLFILKIILKINIKKYNYYEKVYKVIS